MTKVKGKYTAYIVFNHGEFSGVFESRSDASEFCNKINNYYHDNGCRIETRFVESKRDLEDLIEDDLTDDQANLYLTERK